MRTRAKIVAAGRRVFAEKGVDATTIGDITEAADVGRGSFYNFFPSKEALAHEIAMKIVEDTSTVAKMLSERCADIAVVVAGLSYWGMVRLDSDPVQGWFILGSNISVLNLVRDLHLALVQRGLANGRFSVLNADLGQALWVGMGAGFSEARLDGRLKSVPGLTLAEQVLRMLGLAPSEAAKVAREAADLVNAEIPPILS